MTRKFEAYPKWKYAEGQEPRLVQTFPEESALGEDWFDKPDFTNHLTDISKYSEQAHHPEYVPIEYPKWLYAPEIPGGVLVESSDEEDALDQKHPGVTFFHKPDFTNFGQSESIPPFDAADEADTDDTQDDDTQDDPPAAPVIMTGKTKKDADDLL